MPDPKDNTPDPNVAVRGFAKFKRAYEKRGNDIKFIRIKGSTAKTLASERSIFSGMMKTIENLMEKFEEAWEAAIEYAETHNITPQFPSQADLDYFQGIKNYYYEAFGFQEDIARSVSFMSSPPGHSSRIGDSRLSHASVPGRAILPKIHIKTFRGDFAAWPTFKQLFTSLIIEEPSLSDAERYHFLLSYLDGPALDTVKSISVTEANFNQAWAAVTLVYDNRRKQARSYIDKLLDFKPGVGKPTAESLQSYLSHVSESIVSLKALNIPQFDDYLLCELALRNLDPVTRHAFEVSIISKDYPHFNDLKEFVQGRFKVLHLSSESGVKSEPAPFKNVSGPKRPNSFTPKSHSNQALLTHASKPPREKASPKESSSLVCPLCKQQHILVDCPTFKSSTPAQRLESLRQWSGCRNCLYPFHKTKECKSKWSCKFCKARHHSDLHLGSKDSSTSSSSQSLGSAPPSPASPEFAGTHTSSTCGVLLGTVRASILDANGRAHVFRGLLDPGSHVSFITDQCARKLGKTTRPYRGHISGVNGSPLKNISGRLNISFQPPSTSALTTEVIVVPSITPSLPQSNLTSSMWHDYLSYNLSDPDFSISAPISFLIGADLYTDVVVGAPLTIHEDGPRLMETVFGFTVIGRFNCTSESDNAVALLALTDPSFPFERFWEVEEPYLTSPSLSTDDQECEDHFVRSHYRINGGRYVVSLPFKSQSPIIKPNVKVALNRFYALEAKLQKNEQLRIDYHAFMAEYIHLNHMSPATSPASYLIPHHPIYKVDGEGKGKLRVVFDASFRTLSGSLNDHLHTGQKLQADIGSIVLNFRRFQYVFTCDIVKMFRQILVNPDERHFQQIAWRFSPDDAITYYELNTVTYGLRSSPFQAQRVLQQLVLDEGSNYPAGAEAISHCIYVDDVAAGCDSISNLLALRHQVVELLAKGGFELGKWNSNYPPLLSEPIEQQPVELCNDEATSSVIKILGMTWDPQADVFKYSVQQPDSGTTKRNILSVIARLYDPLGYLAPVVFYAKCILQETWKSGVQWDEDVPDLVKTRWDGFLRDFCNLSQIEIPRLLVRTDTVYRLVCFSDASEKGYCAIAYLHGTQSGVASMSLLKAKTRLAPLKPLTIPRLELSGALLLSQLIHSLQPLIRNLNISSIFCFTDSTIVLSWIKMPAHQLKTYVSNRTQQILSVTSQEMWFHISGVENPADVGSRGVLPSSLLHHDLWWSGPPWCSQPPEQWPISQSVQIVDIPETKPVQTTTLVTVKSCNYILSTAERYSSFLRLVRVVGFVRRFITNCRIPKRKRRKRKIGPLSSHEFDGAHVHLIRHVQQHYFPEVFKRNEVDALPLELRRLSIFIDHEGVIRVGGRLSNAPLPIDQRYPILLPSRSHVTNLVIDYLHKKNHHPGPTAMLAFIRQRYWIPKARNLVRLHKMKCVVCTRYSKAFVQPLMGDLPASRVSGIRPFLQIGVDFAGPFICRESARRNAKTHKCYLCVFICMASRAVHLELCTSLSVEAFLDAFDRFIARRGIPVRVQSDCGTNFVGAAGYLREVQEWVTNPNNQASIIDHTSHLSVEWSFNPPGSPHFGGSWESAVKSAKTHLRKTLGDKPFTESELHTLFIKIEGILNSRPLQPLSESADDAEALTPGHFIIGQPTNAIPEPDFSDVPTNRLDRWQLLRERVQHFWQRWTNEYLPSLQERSKWTKTAPNLKIGDVVIVRGVNTSPAHWPLGRVVEVHPGSDGTVRVVSIKTQTGIFKRSSVNLIPLHVNDSNTDSDGQ